MTRGNEWFMEYQMLSNEEKEVYREFIFDTEERATILDYERFKNTIELMASKPDDLRTKYNEKLNVAEEVALAFDNECVYVAHHLRSEKCINEEIYNLVIQIHKQLELLSNEHDKKNWTIQAMNNDRRWIKARTLANQVYKLLICT